MNKVINMSDDVIIDGMTDDDIDETEDIGDNIIDMAKDDDGPIPENVPARRPTLEELEDEINRLETGHEIKNSIFGTIRSLIVIAAAAVLVANLLIAVLQVSKSSSMAPTLREGEVVIALRWIGVKPGDVIAFHYNNKILLKRVIAKEGDIVDIDENGTVYVNNEALDEPYLTEASLGEYDIDLPYQVPAASIFVMGDNRATSADSRMKEIGPVSTELIIGKVLFRIWPLSKLGLF